MSAISSAAPVETPMSAPMLSARRRLDLIRVVIADDHAIVRIGLRAVLVGVRDVEVVGEASDAAGTRTAIERLRPDVVVTDAAMAGAEALLAEYGEGSAGAPRIVVLTAHADDERALPLLQAGVAGILPKHTADRELLDAVRIVARGGRYVRPARTQPYAAASEPDAAVRKADDYVSRYVLLSPRERAVLRLVAEGNTAARIGELLAISQKTAETYKERIREKMGFTSRTEYVRAALEVGALAG